MEALLGIFCHERHVVSPRDHVCEGTEAEGGRAACATASRQSRIGKPAMGLFEKELRFRRKEPSRDIGNAAVKHFVRGRAIIVASRPALTAGDVLRVRGNEGSFLPPSPAQKRRQGFSTRSIGMARHGGWEMGDAAGSSN